MRAKLREQRARLASLEEENLDLKEVSLLLSMVWMTACVFSTP